MGKSFMMHSEPRQTWFTDADIAGALGCRVASIPPLRLSGALPYRPGHPPMVSGEALAEYAAARIEQMAKRTADLIEARAAADAAEHTAALGGRGGKAAPAASTKRRHLSELAAERLRQRAVVAGARMRAIVDGSVER